MSAFRTDGIADDEVCRLGRECRRRACRGDHGNTAPGQISRKLRQPVILIIGEPIDDCQVLAFHVADVF
jgi:hypothetical protein